MHPTTPAAGTDRGYTFGQTAAALGVDVLTVRRWARTEQCPIVTVGRARRVPSAWVAEQVALLAAAGGAR